MIIEYQRPATISEALSLLARKQPISYPMGGGTYLNRSTNDQFAVVDLQALGLGTITKRGNILQLGSTITLQEILDFTDLPEAVYSSIKLETTYNLRQMATIAGTLITANGRSPLTTVLLAMDANLEELESDGTPVQVRLGDWLPLRDKTKPGKLISKISLQVNIKISSERIARTPADQSIVCVALAQWPSGRTRLTVAGWGEAPILAMDGPQEEGLEVAARNAASQAGDEWASAEYRQEMAGILAQRCLQQVFPKE